MTRRGWLLFAAMCVIWGIPYLLIRVAVREVSPATLVLARTAIATALLLPVALARRELAVALRRWAPLLAFAAIEIAVPWILLGAAEKRISSSLTGLLVAAVPLVSAVIARTTGARQRLGPVSLIGLLLGLAGVGAIVGVNVHGAGAVPIAEVALVAVCYAVGPVILERRLAGLPALGVMAAALAGTTVAYVPIAAFSFPATLPSVKVLGSMLALAVVCTALAFLVFIALIQTVGPMRATVITYVNPAVASAVGVGILGESFSAGMGVGFALVLAGSVLATRPPPAPAVPHDPVCDSP
jgi:drug/metabolite transporter (DMT)-like permease